MNTNLVHGPTISGAATAAITKSRAVKIGSGTTQQILKLTQAGAGEAAIGIAGNSATSANDPVGVNVFGSICYAEANGNSVNIAAGDPLKSDASGILVKGASTENIVAIALEPCTADGDEIRVMVVAPNSSISTVATLALTESTTSGTVTAAQISASQHVFVNTTHASATALAIPAAADVPNGRLLTVKRTGGANAVTITPSGGTINGGANYTALDAVGDVATFVALGTDWVLANSTIA